MSDNDPSTSGINAISQLEKKLLADINRFNTIYYCYLHGNANTSSVKSSYNPPSCTGANYTQNDVRMAYEAIDQDIMKIDASMAIYRNNSGTTQSQYTVALNEIKKNYQNLLKKRQDLDQKLAEIYGTNDGVTSFYNNMYMNTMFTKIGLTILVTSLVYYTFMKLIKKK